MTPSPPIGDTTFVYTGRTMSWWAVASAGVSAALLAVMVLSSGASGSDLLIVLPLLLIAIGVLVDVLTASSVRATAGPNGFSVRWGSFGWPRCSYSIDQIVRAEIVDLPWWRVSWGFWWTPNRTSCTLRSGPTVRLSLVSGRIVTVTVPEPTSAVAALHAAKADRDQTERRT